MSINQLFFKIKPFVFFLDKYRPHPATIDASIFFQKQVFHLQALKLKPDTRNRIVFLGNSSVIQGIDTEIIRDIFSRKAFPLNPYNYGLVGLSALDLPMLKQYVLDDKIQTVVYIYNTFSFGQKKPSDKSTTRWNVLHWNTYEFLNMVGLDSIFLYRDKLGNGLAGDLFPLFRYNLLLKNYITRFISGTLKPLDYPHEFPPDAPELPPRRPRNVTAVDNNHFRRIAYVNSDTDNETLSYKNLSRFLDLAAEQNIQVVLAPAPEPEFADYGLRQGINVKRIDAHVKRIADAKNMIFLPRDEIKYIEANDTYFTDTSHLHTGGRNEYSKWIAHKIIDIFNRDR